jgi:hypothetical protein
MRRKWVYDPETRGMVEVTPAARADIAAPAVWGDFKPVNVGGQVIDDRGRFHRYLKQNELVPYHEAKPVAERARADRAKREKRERLQSVIDAYHRVRDRNS